jgi:hypothetical protein
MQPVHAARPAVAPALAAPPTKAVFQPRLELGPRGEEETRLRSSVIRNLLSLPGWYSRLPEPLRISRTEALLDLFTARYPIAGAAAWLDVLQVHEIASPIDNPGGWIRKHLTGYAGGWVRKTSWHVALLDGDLPRAVELFRINVRRKAAGRAREEARKQQAEALNGWSQALAEDRSLAAELRDVTCAFQSERGGVTNPVTGYGAHERVPSGGPPHGAVGLVPAPVGI